MATRDPAAILLEDAFGVVTYAEADELMNAIGGYLQERKVHAGDRVAILAAPGRAYVLFLLALWRNGVVACPLNARRPVSWLQIQVKRLGARAIVADEDHAFAGVDRWSIDLFQTVVPAPRPSTAVIQMDRIATILSTAGSTGEPKSAALRYANLYYSATGSNHNIALDRGDAWMLSLPLYHVGGLGIVMRCVTAGATVVLSDAGGYLRPSPSGRPVTHLSLVPTQLHRLLQGHPGGLPQSLKAVLLGGAPAPARLIQEAIRRGAPLHVSYGLTEMSSQVTTTSVGADAEELRTSGRLLPFRELVVSDFGEILVRGRTLFAGYATPEGLQLPLDGEGWYHTGDFGRWDDRGNLVVRGRVDNLFISGGENIQPEEVEWALLELEDVAEAVVVPVRDAEFGQRPVAFVRMHSGTPDAATIRSELRRRLPGYMIPIAVHDWPAAAREGLKPSREQFAALASASHATRD